jgi:hypothetical protein
MKAVYSSEIHAGLNQNTRRHISEDGHPAVRMLIQNAVTRFKDTMRSQHPPIQPQSARKYHSHITEVEYCGGTKSHRST